MGLSSGWQQCATHVLHGMAWHPAGCSLHGPSQLTVLNCLHHGLRRHTPRHAKYKCFQVQNFQNPGRLVRLSCCRAEAC